MDHMAPGERRLAEYLHFTPALIDVAWALLPAAPAILPVPGLRFQTRCGHCTFVSFHRRRLPHIHVPGQSLFVSWHLHGSLPRSVYPPGKLLTGQAFVSVDRHLDNAQRGPLYLRLEAVAQIVVDSIRRGAELGHYDLHAFVVMPNHVHVLLTPRVLPSRLLKSLKGCTAHAANRVLGRTGEAFWQRESYDHWVRDEAEFQRIGAYIEDNPVKAGLVARACDYRWSSAANVQPPGIEKSLDAAKKSVHATTEERAVFPGMQKLHDAG